MSVLIFLYILIGLTGLIVRLRSEAGMPSFNPSWSVYLLILLMAPVAPFMAAWHVYKSGDKKMSSKLLAIYIPLYCLLIFIAVIYTI